MASVIRLAVRAYFRDTQRRDSDPPMRRQAGRDLSAIQRRSTRSISFTASSCGIGSDGGGWSLPERAWRAPGPVVS